MKSNKNSGRGSRRNDLKKTRQRQALFNLESLEERQLLANAITISTAAGALTTIPAGATTFSDHTDYTINPSAFVGATGDVTLRANYQVTITAPIVNMPHSLDIETHRHIEVDANVSTVAGKDITLDGTNSTRTSSVRRYGVILNNATVSSGGNLTVTGNGYTTGVSTATDGVYLNDSSLVATGAGHNVVVTGTLLTNDYGDGVGVLVGGGSSIYSQYGNVTVTGTSLGVTGDLGHDYGVFVDGGQISSVDGNVSVTGTGATGSDGNDNYGVLVWASGFTANNPDGDSLGTGGTSTSASITSTLGAVTVTGYGGGTGAASYGSGVNLNAGGVIGSGALGTVSVIGTGGAGTGGYNSGVDVWNYDNGPSTMITSGGGNVSVTGTGGSGGISPGVGVATGGLITAGGLGSVGVTGTGGSDPGPYNAGVLLQGNVVGGTSAAEPAADAPLTGITAMITSSGGNVTVTGTGGGSTGSTAAFSEFGVGVGPLAAITAGGLGSVNVTGTGGNADGGDNVGVAVYGVGVSGATGPAVITSSGGDITILGNGGGVGTTSDGNSGVSITAGGQIVGTGFATVSVTGNGGASSGSGNDGVVVDDKSFQVATSINSQGGEIWVTGTGGGTGATGDSDVGVLVENSGTIASSGTGVVNVYGFGGSGVSDNIGVSISNNSSVTSFQGSVNVSGTGGGSDSGSDNVGVLLSNLAGISSSATQYVTVNGTGGLGTSGADGVHVTQDSAIYSDGTITVTGTGGGSTGSQNDIGVALDSTGFIDTSGKGDIVVTGTGGVGSSDEIGVYLSGQTGGTSGVPLFNSISGLIYSADGNISVSGYGGGATGSTGDSNIGVELLGASIGSTGSGNVSVTGIGGTGTSFNDGVYLSGNPINTNVAPLGSLNSPTIYTVDGNISVTGTGGGTTGIGGNDVGVYVLGATIGATGSGNVGITGTGGVGLTEEDGVFISGVTLLPLVSPLQTIGAFSTVSSVDGNVTVKGTGGGTSGSGGADVGVYLLHGEITSTGSGNVKVTGTGGVGVTGEDGVFVSGAIIGGAVSPLAPPPVSTAISSVDGDVTVTGTGGGTTGSGGSDVGVYVLNASIKSTGIGNVSVKGTGGVGLDNEDGVFVSGATAASGVTPLGAPPAIFGITSVDGDLSVIGFGGGTTGSGGNDDGVQLLDATIESTGIGNLTMNGTGGIGASGDYGILTQAGKISTTSGELTLTGTGGSGYSSDSGVAIILDSDENSSSVTTTGGDITVTGTGGGDGSDNDGIDVLSSTISAGGAGNVTINGTGSGSTQEGDYNYGVYENGSSLIKATGTGAVNVTGIAGASNGGYSNIGVALGGASSIETADGGAITVTGTGGASPGGASNTGVWVYGSSTILSTGGNVTLLGTGGNGGDVEGSGYNDGVEIYGDGEVAALVTGDTNVTGVAGSGLYQDSGVFVNAGSSIGSLTSTGNVTVTGTGGNSTSGTKNVGVYLDGGVNVLSSGGNVTVTGNGGGGSDSNAGVVLISGAQVSASGAGTLTVTGTGGGSTTDGSQNQGIIVEYGSSITAASGNLTVTGTGGGGDNQADGVVVQYGGTIGTTGGGNVTVLGTAGGFGDPVNASDNIGVLVQASSNINTTLGGSVSVTGLGGGGGGQSNDGVDLNYGGNIQSNGGDVTVLGTGGSTGAGQNNDGVNLKNGSKIAAIASGDVTVTGKGGSGSYYDVGVYLQAGTSITSGIDGNVTVTGTGGAYAGTAAGDNQGVDAGGSISSGDHGAVNVTGTGGSGGGYQNWGVHLEGSISSPNGPVNVTGTGGSGTTWNYGVILRSGGSITSGTQQDPAVILPNDGLPLGGPVTVLGIGGTGSGSETGVFIQGSTITSTNANSVSVTGIGGDGGGSGIFLSETSKIAALGTGNVTVAGTGVSGSNAVGIGLNDSTISATSTGNVDVTGVGGTGGSYNYGIDLVSTSAITGVDGNVTVSGTGGGSVGGIWNIGGFLSEGSEINTTGAGAVTVNGTGGQGDSFNMGLRLIDGSEIASGGDGAVDVTGTGGPGASSGIDNLGVYLRGTITSGGGDVNVTGTAGSGSNSCEGIQLTSATIRATSTGSVDVTGIGGNGGGYSYGVSLYASTITAANGNVTVTGTGGSSLSGNSNFGVFLTDGSQINTTGTGAVTVNGTGGNGPSGSYNDGVAVIDGSAITSAGGDLSVTGTAGSGNDTTGVYLAGATVSASLSGKVDVTGIGGTGGYYSEGVYLHYSTITGAAGNVTVTGTGGGSVSGLDNIGIWLKQAEISSDGGNVTVSGTGGLGGNANGVALTTATISASLSGKVEVTGIGGTGGSSSDGVTLNSNSGITAIDGSVTVTGTGGGSVGGNHNIGINLVTNSQIQTTGAGAVTVTGTGGQGTDWNEGVQLFYGSEISSGGAGAVNVTGIGGPDVTGGSSNLGVYLFNNSTITSGGGDVNVTGTSEPQAFSAEPPSTSNNNNNVGISVRTGSTISSGGGNVTVTGTGASVAGADSDLGIYLGRATITATSSGDVTVNGTGGSGGNYATGVYVGYSTITTNGTGSVTVTGVGGSGGKYNYGVQVYYNGKISSGGIGDVTITGTGGNGSSGDGNNVGVGVGDNSQITSGGGDVSVTGTGGSSVGGSYNSGVEVSGGSMITATASGTVNVNGTGGNGGSSAFGVYLNYSSSITSTEGSVTVSGTGGGIPGNSGGSDIGVAVLGVSTIAAGGAGNTTVLGYGGAGYSGEDYGVHVSGSGSTISSSGGLVSVFGAGGGVGGGVGQNDGVNVAIGGLITSSAGGQVSVTGVGGSGNGYNAGVRVLTAGSITESDGGAALSVTGTGGGQAGDAGYDVGVAVETDGSIQFSGDIDIIGTGGPGGGHDYGVQATGTSVEPGPGIVPNGKGTPGFIQSGGSLTVTGTGGGANGSQGYDDGVELDTGGNMTAALVLTVTGTGGGFGIGQDDGIRLTDTGSLLEATGAGMSITGTGGGHGNSTGSSGIAILNGAQLVWDGDPSNSSTFAPIIGTGGIGLGGGNDGILIDGTGSAIVYQSSVGVNTSITGNSGQVGTAPGYGIQLTNGGQIDGMPQPAPVVVPNDDFTGVGLYLYADSILVDQTSALYNPNQEVYIDLSNQGTILGEISSSNFVKDGLGALTLQAAVPANPSQFSIGDLTVNQGTVIFANEPALHIGAQPAYVESNGTLTLGAGSTISQVELDGGTLNGSNPKGTAGGVESTGDSTISPGSTTEPGVIALGLMQLQSTDTVVFKLGQESSAFNQPIPGIDYDQIQVNGYFGPSIQPNSPPGVDLNSATLSLVPFGFNPPEPGTIYTLISNPHDVPIVGIFNGLPEGAAITVGGIQFHISYHGGAANNGDVILYSTASTSTQVQSITGESTYGQMVTIQATVQGVSTSLIPNGLVEFKLADGTLLGSSMLDSNGLATFSTNALPAGDDLVYAYYEGATSFNPSDNTVSQTVDKATPTASIASVQSTTVYGQIATFTASVLPAAPGVQPPTGTGTFYDVTTATTLATNVPLVNGLAVFSVSNLSVEAHTIRFTYDSGDSNYNSSEPVSVVQTVNQDSTQITLTASAPTTVYGQTVGFTVYVSSLAPGAFVPNGQFSLTDSVTSTTYGPFTLTNGSANVTLSNLSTGTHSFTANYSGSDSFLTSSSAPLSHEVDKSPTRMGVITEENPSTFGGSVEFGVFIYPIAPGAGTPTGTLGYIVDGVLNTVPVSETEPTIVTIPDLSAGPHQIFFLYGGDDNFNICNDVYTQVIGQTTATAVLSDGPSTSYYGTAVPYTVTVTGTNDLPPTGTVQLDINGSFYSQANLVPSTGAVATATFSVVNLDPSSDTISALYQGDQTYSAVATNTASLTVAAATTQVTNFTSSVPSPIAGIPVTLSAQVSVTNGAGNPVGMIQFLDVTDPLHPISMGLAQVLNGVATLQNAVFAGGGSRNLSAVYLPQGIDFATSSAQATLTVTPSSTTLGLIAPSVAYTESAVTLTATLGALGSVPNGIITFYDNGVPIGTVPVNPGGVTSLTLPNLPQGKHAFVATFTDPSGGYEPSTSPVVNTDVQRNPLAPVASSTSVIITPIYLPPPSSVDLALGGRNTRVVFDIQVKATVPGVPAPGGTITVFLNGNAAGTYTLDSQGETTVTMTGNSIFNKTFSVRFNGDVEGVTTYGPSNSTPFVADRNFFYSNSPNNNSGAGGSVVKTKKHPVGPHHAFGGHKVHHHAKVSVKQMIGRHLSH